MNKYCVAFSFKIDELANKVVFTQRYLHRQNFRFKTCVKEIDSTQLSTRRKSLNENFARVSLDE